jgi:hypothetical protein
MWVELLELLRNSRVRVREGINLSRVSVYKGY